MLKAELVCLDHHALEILALTLPELRFPVSRRLVQRDVLARVNGRVPKRVTKLLDLRVVLFRKRMAHDFINRFAQVELHQLAQVAFIRGRTLLIVIQNGLEAAQIVHFRVPSLLLAQLPFFEFWLLFNGLVLVDLIDELVDGDHLVALLWTHRGGALNLALSLWALLLSTVLGQLLATEMCLDVGVLFEVGAEHLLNALQGDLGAHVY